MPSPERIEPGGLSGNVPSDLQAALATLSGVWELGSWSTSPTSRRATISAASRRRCCRSSRARRAADGRTDEVAADVVAKGATAAEQFLIRWRGEADPKAVRAVDTYWVSTAEHGLNASTFTARIAASTGADCGAALSSAVGALSGPLHGGAPAYVKPMLDEVAAIGDAEKCVKDMLDRGERIMGFGHRVYRAEDPRSRVLKETARELGSPQVEVAEAARGGRARRRSSSVIRSGRWRRTSSSGRRSCSTSPRSRRRSRLRCSPARASPAGRRTSSSSSGPGG